MNSYRPLGAYFAGAADARQVISDRWAVLHAEVFGWLA